MSLIGNLEDLSLADILQIINLSGKSGVLIIRRGSEEGKIYLRQGKVILTTSARNKRNLGNILLDKKLATSDQIKAAAEEQKKGGMKELFGVVLVRMGILDDDLLEEIVKEQIKESIFYFLTWQEGNFKFDLRTVDNRLEVGIDPHLLISQSGIDTQWLVLEGTRLLDEHRREGAESVEEAFVEWQKSPEAAPEKQSLCLVDDDEYFRELFSATAAARGFTVTSFGGVTEAQAYLASKESRKDLFVVDVVMPTADGRGFLGGLELARKIAAEHPSIKLKTITAYPDDSVQDELRVAGAGTFILKPEIPAGERGAEVMGSFLEEILAACAKAPAPPPVKEAAAEPVKEEAPVREEDFSAQIAEARGILESKLEEDPYLGHMAVDLIGETEMAQNPSEIGLIMLRFASETLERAILFKADAKEAVSLGGFGFETTVIKNRDGLRNLAIGLADSKLLSRAVKEVVMLGSPQNSFAEDDLLGMVLGPPVPSSWIIIPARGVGGSLLILYGDNGVRDRPIKGQGILGSFMILAGLIMNRLHQARKTAGVPAGGGPPEIR